jgi:16S rRNA (guanine527-N7)-methyltransferase
MDSPELISRYFPLITDHQQEQFRLLGPLYSEWNNRINVISRKDIDFLYERHILHSLGIARVMSFSEGTKVLDVGTGGGFPGIPLAILFPQAQFHLVDSIGKKIKVVSEIAQSIGLSNVTASHVRAEEVKGRYHFVVSRAVTAFPDFYSWVRNKFEKESFNPLPNGILYLKGGDLREELKDFPHARLHALDAFFREPFFETKKVVYLER